MGEPLGRLTNNVPISLAGQTLAHLLANGGLDASLFV